MPGKMIVGYLLLSFLIAVVRTNSVAELVGTWTTKSRSVVTGPDFYDPINDRLLEPRLTGISYSFTADGYYEQAYYRAVSNRQLLPTLSRLRLLSDAICIHQPQRLRVLKVSCCGSMANTT